GRPAAGRRGPPARVRPLAVRGRDRPAGGGGLPAVGGGTPRSGATAVRLAVLPRRPAARPERAAGPRPVRTHLRQRGRGAGLLRAAELELGRSRVRLPRTGRQTAAGAVPRRAGAGLRGPRRGHAAGAFGAAGEGQ